MSKRPVSNAAPFESLSTIVSLLKSPLSFSTLASAVTPVLSLGSAGVLGSAIAGNVKKVSIMPMHISIANGVLNLRIFIFDPFLEISAPRCRRCMAATLAACVAQS